MMGKEEKGDLRRMEDGWKKKVRRDESRVEQRVPNRASFH